MTVAEAISKAEEILGSIPVVGRENVKRVNVVFDILDATIAVLNKPQGEDENGTVQE